MSYFDFPNISNVSLDVEIYAARQQHGRAENYDITIYSDSIHLDLLCMLFTEDVTILYTCNFSQSVVVSLQQSA